MRAIRMLLLVPLLLVMTVSAQAEASDDLPRSFAECVAMGGDVRRVEDDVTCRHIVTGTMRTYYIATTECGEEVEGEIWSDVVYGVVTYAFSPERTEVLPEVVRDTFDSLDAPIPCLAD